MALNVEMQAVTTSILYQGNEELLAASLERIRSTAVEILSHIEDEKNVVVNQEVTHAA